MPSPFPGMDPYLESPRFFPDLHNGLIIMLQAELQACLPENYFAATGERLWIEYPRRAVLPDVGVGARNGGLQPPRLAATEAGVMTAVRSRPVRVSRPSLEMREPFLEVYLQEDSARLVALIEVLSPTNKTGGEHARAQYLKKQAEILERDVHLVEIDLLRAGLHTTAMPREEAVHKAGPMTYHVSVRDSSSPNDFFVYPISLPQSLPELTVPLLPGVQPVEVDLQRVFERAYDIGGYPRRVRYDGPVPPPALSAPEAAWVQAILHEKGLLSASEKGQP